MSHGILQLAVSGIVPLQLEYSRIDGAFTEPQPAESDANYLNQTLDDEFTCLLELI